MSFRLLLALKHGWLISYIIIYHLFAGSQYFILLSLQLFSKLEFCLWRLNMTFSDKEMKGLGRSTEINIHNSRSLTCVHLKYVSNILRLEETLTVEELAHAHTHTHTQSHPKKLLLRHFVGYLKLVYK